MVGIEERLRGFESRGSMDAIFLHGAGGAADLWDDLRGALGGPGAALDLPGHGAEPGPGASTIAAYAAFVARAIEARGGAPVFLVGHSMGGAVALTLALEAPHLVGALALLSTGARLGVARGIFDAIADDWAGYLDLLGDFAFAPGASAAARARARAAMERAGPAVARGDFTACNAYDVRPRLGEVCAPALVLCGRSDLLTPPLLARTLAEGLPRAELVLLEEVAHMTHLEAPAEVACHLARFREGLEP